MWEWLGIYIYNLENPNLKISREVGVTDMKHVEHRGS
jgi:hypothetical protein